MDSHVAIKVYKELLLKKYHHYITYFMINNDFIKEDHCLD